MVSFQIQYSLVLVLWFCSLWSDTAALTSKAYDRNDERQYLLSPAKHGDQKMYEKKVNYKLDVHQLHVENKTKKVF